MSQPAAQRLAALPRLIEAGEASAARAVASPRWRSFSSLLGAALAAALWIGLTTWRLDSVPGLSMDEAWSIVSARGEWPPENPLSGMTSYAGPFPVLLLELLGTRSGLWVLRLASVLANGALLCLLGFWLRQLYPSRSTLVWALPLLATTPVWLVTARTGIEVTMLLPLLGVLGVYLLWRGSPRAAFAAGLTWGLMVYSHVIGLAVPGAVLLAWLVVYRRRPPVPWRPLLLGALLGLAPRLAALALYHAPLTGSAANYAPWAAIKDLIWLPKAFWQTWHGDTVYLRYVGRLGLEIWPYGLLLFGFFLPWLRCLRQVPRQAWFTLVAALGTAVLMTVGAPYIAVRFLVLPVLGLNLFCVLLGAAAIERGARFGLCVRGSALLLTVCQLGYVLANFHVPWREQELGVTTFFLGARSKRTSSWAYLPKQELVRELQALSPPPEQVLAHPSLQRPLLALLSGTGLGVKLPKEADPAKSSVFVDYDWPPLADPLCVDLGTRPTCYRKPVSVASYYVLYERQP